MAMYNLRRFLSGLLFSICVIQSSAKELTFELPDNDRQCFHEVIDKDVKCTLEFQVISGGNYDVDMTLTSPSKRHLYKEVKKQYDSYTWTTAEKGEYVFCFSNEFSTFTHKVVYFDLEVGDEDDDKLFPDDKEGTQHTAMTQMEMATVTVHENLKAISDYQTHHRNREFIGRGFAEDLNERVQLWSVGESVLVLLIGIGQVLVLRSFFSDKRNAAPAVST